MTIYIVTSGEYSDYGIRYVFTNKAAADDCVAEYKKAHRSDDVEVEEHEASDSNHIKCLPLHSCRINLSSGLISDEESFNGLYSVNQRGDSKRDEKRGFISVVSRVSMEHAHKFAVDSRQRYLSEGIE